MTQWYRIGDNTSYKRGMPVVEEIVDGIVGDDLSCGTCGVSRREPSGDMVVIAGDDKARMWPDAIACGDYPLFVVSDRFVRAFEESRLKLYLGGRVRFREPLRNGLSLADAPDYFWIDGPAHFGGWMDFDASGFVDVEFCPECGNRTDNISETYDRQHYSDPPPPYKFEYVEDSGLDLITTDLSPCSFFCTDRVLECARRFRLTNLSFEPVEKGVYGKPLKYL